MSQGINTQLTVSQDAIHFSLLNSTPGMSRFQHPDTSLLMDLVSFPVSCYYEQTRNFLCVPASVIASGHEPRVPPVHTEDMRLKSSTP